MCFWRAPIPRNAWLSSHMSCAAPARFLGVFFASVEKVVIQPFAYDLCSLQDQSRVHKHDALLERLGVPPLSACLCICQIQLCMGVHHALHSHPSLPAAKDHGLPAARHQAEPRRINHKTPHAIVITKLLRRWGLHATKGRWYGLQYDRFQNEKGSCNLSSQGKFPSVLVDGFDWLAMIRGSAWSLNRTQSAVVNASAPK